MALRIDVEFEGKLTCAFKNVMRNLTNFHRALKTGKKWDFHEIVWSKVGKYDLKIYRGFLCHDNEEWCKIWKEIDLFKIGMRHFTDFDPSAWKSQPFAL